VELGDGIRKNQPRLWASIADNDKYDVPDAQPDPEILDAIFADLDHLLADVE
jgi:hypothetical protein